MGNQRSTLILEPKTLIPTAAEAAKLSDESLPKYLAEQKLKEQKRKELLESQERSIQESQKRYFLENLRNAIKRGQTEFKFCNYSLSNINPIINHAESRGYKSTPITDEN